MLLWLLTLLWRLASAVEDAAGKLLSHLLVIMNVLRRLLTLHDQCISYC
jgi:hypothetical protein